MDSEFQLITMIYSKIYYVNKIADSHRDAMTKNKQFTEVIEQFFVERNEVSGHYEQTQIKTK